MFDIGKAGDLGLCTRVCLAYLLEAFGHSFRVEKIETVYRCISKLESILINPLSGNFARWSNTLKQFVGNLPTNCLSLFDHFTGLALKGLMRTKLETENVKRKNCNFFIL